MLARAISLVFLWNISVGSLELEPHNATLVNRNKKRATLSDCSLAARHWIAPLATRQKTSSSSKNRLNGSKISEIPHEQSAPRIIGVNQENSERFTPNIHAINIDKVAKTLKPKKAKIIA